ncbi:MAG TPA: Ig-like domain-containing protein [Gemmatimonadales bacterium]|nr:Ig-like domain-containing protein [Gemmatimonadales bacterium]
MRVFGHARRVEGDIRLGDVRHGSGVDHAAAANNRPETRAMNCDVRHRARTLVAAVTLAALACKGTESPPTTGRIQVTTATTGADLDPDGYAITLQGDTATGTSGNTMRQVAVQGTVTFSDLKPGGYSLALGGAAANCPVGGQNPRVVTVTAGGTAQVTFQIGCVQRVDMSGVWNFTEQFGSPLACNDTGSFVFTTTGDGFTGSSDQVGTCDQQAGSVDNSLSASVSGNPVYSASGAVSVTFSSGGCFYAADVVGTPPDHLTNGSVSCSSGSGPWAAVRGGGPISSVTVTPANRSVVAGGLAQLRAVLIDASGSRRVGPTVIWSSDASGVATVDPSGVVFGVAPGSATITAGAESKTGTASVGVEVVTFTTVQAGAYHSCGLTTSGAAYCWGNGTYGQLGSGAKANGLAPVLVTGGLTFTAISVGGVHSCGLTTSGSAYCWGLNYWGELGALSPGGQVCSQDGVLCSVSPIPVVGGRVFSSVSAGWNQSCALVSGGAAFCWGDDTYGALGDGSTTSSTTPGAVTGNLAFVSIGTGALSACGLTAAGAAYCWGNNTAGQLGVGPGGPETCSGEPCSTTPIAVSGGLTFTELSVGYWQACGRTSQGATYCWGDNVDGQLGATTTETCTGLSATVPCSTVPLPVEGGVTFASVSAGSFQTCGATADGTGYCWGANGDGQLGNGTTDFAPTPTPVAGGLSFAALSAFGRWHSCGLTTASLTYCWGYNGWGQVGNGTFDEVYQPVAVLGQAVPSGATPVRAARLARRLIRVASKPLSARPPRP